MHVHDLSPLIILVADYAISSILPLLHISWIHYPQHNVIKHPQSMFFLQSDKTVHTLIVDKANHVQRQIQFLSLYSVKHTPYQKHFK